MSRGIESLIADGDWASAEALIRTELATDSSNHWLLARLSLTYYERRQYRRAL
jgi:hypothetical protein